MATLKVLPEDAKIHIVFESNTQYEPLFLLAQLEVNGYGLSDSGFIIKTIPESNTVGTETNLFYVDVEVIQASDNDYERKVIEAVDDGLTLLAESIFSNYGEDDTDKSVIVTASPGLIPEWEKKLPSNYDRVIAVLFVDKQKEASFVKVIFYVDYLTKIVF